MPLKCYKKNVVTVSFLTVYLLSGTAAPHKNIKKPTKTFRTCRKAALRLSMKYVSMGTCLVPETNSAKTAPACRSAWSDPIHRTWSNLVAVPVWDKLSLEPRYRPVQVETLGFIQIKAFGGNKWEIEFLWVFHNFPMNFLNTWPFEDKGPSHGEECCEIAHLLLLRSHLLHHDRCGDILGICAEYNR